MSARSKQIKTVLRLITLLLTISGISFVIEYAQIRDGAKVNGLIIEKHRKASGGGPLADAYEIAIEYQAYGEIRRFTTSRAVWDIWGSLNIIGTKVPILYLKDGNAFIDRFTYLHPFTAMLLVFSTIATVALLWLFVVPQSRIEAASVRAKQYRNLKNGPQKRLSPNRRLLLKRLHLWLIMIGGIAVLLVIGVLIPSPWLVISSFAAIILLWSSIHRILVCPYCGASLKEDLRGIEPRVVSRRTNWLIVRDYLAKGVAVICSNCGHSLDN